MGDFKEQKKLLLKKIGFLYEYHSRNDCIQITILHIILLNLEFNPKDIYYEFFL